jgi:hypothetical protein
MVSFINPYTKTEFLVADDRVEEYKAAGFPLAANGSEKPKVEVKEEPKEEKKTAKRSTRKK